MGAASACRGRGRRGWSDRPCGGWRHGPFKRPRQGRRVATTTRLVLSGASGPVGTPARPLSPSPPPASQRRGILYDVAAVVVGGGGPRLALTSPPPASSYAGVNHPRLSLSSVVRGGEVWGREGGREDVVASESSSL